MLSTAAIRSLVIVTNTQPPLEAAALLPVWQKTKFTELGGQLQGRKGELPAPRSHRSMTCRHRRSPLHQRSGPLRDQRRHSCWASALSPNTRGPGALAHSPHFPVS